ncbi:LAME_0C06524g1_1 [Lachancea meyersii CBS 8951]|uniref:5-hydroxyisourate hydrolase n=1 Tax=Lachancea meyersii CBS 8951 TaxID=1266667 RepID=A0A1G4J2T3_9SACH|nr:LAME_0C06524g1_1 [Lachancea meyersii CBS 8951]
MPRPPVTCHILDTTTGKPARGVVCSIFKLNVDDTSDSETVICEDIDEPFALAKTNSDGRIDSWIFTPDLSKRSFLTSTGVVEKNSRLEWESLVPGFYKIRFQTAKYFAREGKSCFFPFVEIAFTVSDTRHYHIPLLLSNFGYTTYRGS